jgi:predicted molibdopterin-dependent oxidoreductase YjgC
VFPPRARRDHALHLGYSLDETTPTFAGASYDKLEKMSVQWPVVREIDEDGRGDSPHVSARKHRAPIMEIAGAET